MEISITLFIQHNAHIEKNRIQFQVVNGRVRRFQVTGKTSMIATTTRKLRNKIEGENSRVQKVLSKKIKQKLRKI